MYIFSYDKEYDKKYCKLVVKQVISDSFNDVALTKYKDDTDRFSEISLFSVVTFKKYTNGYVFGRYKNKGIEIKSLFK